MKKLYVVKIILVITLAGYIYQIKGQETTRQDRHYIDFNLGCNMNIANYKSNIIGDRISERDRLCFNVDLRYSFFFLKHFGAYANLKRTNPNKQNPNLQFIESIESTHYIIEKTYNKHLSSLSYDFGFLYRFDCKHWSFRPRIGIGRTKITNNGFYFVVKEKDSNNLYTLELSSQNSSYEDIKLANFITGINACYKLHKDIFLTADISYTQVLTRRTFYYQKRDLYERFVKIDSYPSSTLGKELNISLGVSVPIYFYKHKNRKATKDNVTQPVQPLPNL